MQLTDLQLSQLKTVLAHELLKEVEVKDGTVFCLMSLKKGNVEVGHDFHGQQIYFFSEIKPFLRPMSNMTKSEIDIHQSYQDLYRPKGHGQSFFDTPESVLWLLQNHFDIFNLIGSGLAIDKTK